MQTFGNVATVPVRKVSKTTNKGYYEFRLCENSRTSKDSTQFYSVRVMRDVDPGLGKGDFVKVTGTLRVDSYLSREGKPTSTLLIIAFEAVRLKSAQDLREVHDAKQQEGKQETVPA